jgi:hypothetical protein
MMEVHVPGTSPTAVLCVEAKPATEAGKWEISYGCIYYKFRGRVEQLKAEMLRLAHEVLTNVLREVEHEMGIETE